MDSELYFCGIVNLYVAKKDKTLYFCGAHTVVVYHDNKKSAVRVARVKNIMKNKSCQLAEYDLALGL